MKTFLGSIVFALCAASLGWAEDPAPTIASNKAAIDLVQTHANYLWTLISNIFGCGLTETWRHWGLRITPRKAWGKDRKSTRLNSSHSQQSRMPSSA